jgi:hypothetical protein
MGVVQGLGDCYCCGKLFSFNPVKVPSYQRQPICHDCIEKVNQERGKKGLSLWPVAPDAYDPADENELE